MLLWQEHIYLQARYLYACELLRLKLIVFKLERSSLCIVCDASKLGRPPIGLRRQVIKEEKKLY